MLDFWKKLTAGQAILLTIVFTLFLSLTAIAAGGAVQSGEEAKTAGIAAEMAVGGNWLLPKLNNVPFLEYPPMHSWLTAASFRLFGINAFAARLPSALAALAVALLVFRFARRSGYPPWGAAAASLMTVSATFFFTAAGCCRPDMLLTAFIIGAVYCFMAMTATGNRILKLLYLLAATAAMTGGIYTRGLPGTLLPAAVIGIWLAWSDTLNKRFSFLRYAALALATAASFELSSLWYYMLLKYEGQEILYLALILNDLNRVVSGNGNGAPAYYYFAKLPVIFQPFLLPALAGMLLALRQVRQREFKDETLLMLSFVFIPFTILSTVADKQIVHILPIYAPLALLAVFFLLKMPEKWQTVIGTFFETLKTRPHFRCVATALPVTAFALAAAFTGVERIWLPAAGIIAVIAASAVRKPAVRTAAVLAAVALACSSALALYSRQSVEKEKSLRPLFERCAELERSGWKIAIATDHEPTRGAAYYYLRHPVPRFESAVAAGNEKKTALILRSGTEEKNAERFNDRHSILLINK